MRRRGLFKKRDYERAAKTSISMPTMLLDQAVNRQRQLHLTKFSAYVQRLIEADLATHL